jgi:GTP-binding protein Era
MTRAKHRAGIPVTETNPTKQPTKKPTKKSASDNNNSSNRWRTVGYFNPKHSDVKDGNIKRAMLESRLENLGNVRKPAGIMERMIKINNTKVVQPENPHLLKVAVIGAANAGKSTLVNKIVGEEVNSSSNSSNRESYRDF